MAVTVTWADPRDAVRVRDALLTAAAVHAAEGQPVLARRCVEQAADTDAAVRDSLPPMRDRTA